MTAHETPSQAPQHLVAAAVNGDPAAFTQLYHWYRPMVTRVVRARMHGTARHDIADIVATTFERAWAKIGTWTDRGIDIGAWLTTIAMRLVLDYRKSRQHRESACDPGTFNDCDSAPDPGEIAACRIDTQRGIAGVGKVYGKLTPKQRRCLVLRFIDDLSVAETAQVLQLQPSAVKALQYRATRTLNQLLTQPKHRNTTPE